MLEKLTRKYLLKQELTESAKGFVLVKVGSLTLKLSKLLLSLLMNRKLICTGTHIKAFINEEYKLKDI